MRLVEALALRTDIALALWSPPGERPITVEYACTTNESTWLNDLMEQGGIASLLRRGGLSRLTAPLKLMTLLRQVYKRNRKVALFHINWLQNALPLWGLPGEQPALISVLGSDMGLLRLPGMRFMLRQVFLQRRCILAPNADWMVPPLKIFFGDITEILTIPFGIDKHWYTLPRNQTGGPCRWLTVSRVTKKKIGPLFKWAEMHFKDKKNQLHLFGPMQEPVEIPGWIHYHGPTSPQDLMDNWFPKATGLITLSCHDEGRPQVMLEAMAAGLPIIASHLPAHDNLLNHKQTGWLVETPEEFAQALLTLTDASHNELLGQQARRWVKQYIGTWDDCGERYVAAYEKILGCMV